MTRRAVRDRALGALYGLAIGDALGMPTQQMPRALVTQIFGEITTFWAGPPENEISAGFAAGSVTDDTEQAFILAECLLDGLGRVDPANLAARLRAWERVASARGGEQLGPSTRRALDALVAGVPAEEAGRRGDTNGAAMRIAPVGIAFGPDPLAHLVDAVANACALTHNTGLAISGAAAVAAAVSRGIETGSFADSLVIASRAAALGAERGHFSAGALVTRRIEFALQLGDGSRDDETFRTALDELLGTSVATQESVPSAFAIGARWRDDPWRACCEAAGLGGDSDTVGAIVGAMLGATSGVDAWPPEARAAVDEQNDLHLDELVDRLLALRAGH